MNIDLSKFLLSLSESIINQLHTGAGKFDTFDSQVFYNYRISPYGPEYELDTTTQHIHQLIDDFIYKLNKIDHLLYILDEIFVGCEYHIKKEELKKQIDALFHDFLDKLIHCIPENMVFPHEEFMDDYKNTLALLVNDSITIKKAQQSLLLWQDALPEQMLYDALVQLTYTYMKRIMNEFKKSSMINNETF